jgi:hypothetical protein
MRGFPYPKRTACAVFVLFAALAAFLVLSQPAPHSPLVYMVAGTLATAGCLIAAFALFATSRRRIPPR